MDLGQNIKIRRLELNMSQKDLAVAVGYRSPSAIAKIESGDNDLPMSKLEALARALDTSVERLIVGASAPSQTSQESSISATEKGYRCAAIILAGGKSTRNEQNIPNQFINVLGKPVIMYSMEAYQKHPLVDDIIVVCLKGWEGIVKGYADQYGITKLRSIVHAGDSGLESIKQGFEKACALGLTEEDVVIVQETTRPFVTEETISKLLNACIERGSSVICEPLSDHLVFMKKEDGPASYVDRNTILSMQSPDAHRVATLVKMFAEAEEQRIPLTENCCGLLLYELGYPLYFCEGNHNNIKLVRQEDVAVFTALLRLRDM